VDGPFEGTVAEACAAVQTFLQRKIGENAQQLSGLLGAVPDLDAMKVREAVPNDPGVQKGMPLFIMGQAVRAIRQTFKLIDRDGSGTISFDDFHGLGANAHAGFQMLTSRIDKDGDGEISFEEFIGFFTQHSFTTTRVQVAAGSTLNQVLEMVTQRMAQVCESLCTEMIATLSETLKSPVLGPVLAPQTR
jgi:hypothetical protein